MYNFSEVEHHIPVAVIVFRLNLGMRLVPFKIVYLAAASDLSTGGNRDFERLDLDRALFTANDQLTAAESAQLNVAGLYKGYAVGILEYSHAVVHGVDSLGAG